MPLILSFEGRFDGQIFNVDFQVNLRQIKFIQIRNTPINPKQDSPRSALAVKHRFVVIGRWNLKILDKNDVKGIYIQTRVVFFFSLFIYVFVSCSFWKRQWFLSNFLAFFYCRVRISGRTKSKCAISVPIPDWKILS